MFRYKIDILTAVKEAGYSTYRIRKEKLLSEGVLTSLRRGDMIGLNALDNVCHMLNCDIEDVIEHIKETK